MKKLLLFFCILLLFLGCDHWMVLYHEDSVEYRHSLKYDCLTANLEGDVWWYHSLRLHITIEPSESILVKLDNLRIDVNGRPIKYSITEKGKVINKNFLINTKKDVSYRYQYYNEDKFRVGDKVLIYADNFIQCQGEYHDLDTLIFTIRDMNYNH